MTLSGGPESPTWGKRGADAWKGATKQGRVSQDLVFRQLVLRWKIIFSKDPFTPGPPPPDKKVIAEAVQLLIADGEKKGLLSWLELYDLESLIIRSLDDQQLRDEVWNVREEFRILAYLFTV